MDFSLIWNKILDDIKLEVTSLAYETWFKDTNLYKIEDNCIYILVSMPMQKKHLADKYNDLLIGLFEKHLFSIYSIIYLLDDDINNKIEETDNNIYANTNITVENSSFNTNLKSSYCFDTFIVGNSNKFAHAAALAVSENPGNTYNPLFIYGNSGLGKTHLMHAIGNYIIKNSKKRVLYVTSEEFVRDFVGINKKNNDNLDNIEFFKLKYRNVDVLMIDDIQFLGGATHSQNEFFHTFNTLYGEQKQIIISSDRSPDDLKLLEDRLRTRFGWGLTVDIFPPDFELRKEILKKKLVGESINKDIPDEVINYIASNIGSDVRQLEGSITRLLAYSTFMGGSVISLDLAIEALKDYINKGISEKNNIHKIQKIVAEFFQISVEDMKSKKRSANLAFPRQIAMYLCRNLTSESFPKIGTEFGGKDHSTVMHSCDKIEKEMSINKELKNIIDKIKSEIH